MHRVVRLIDQSEKLGVLVEPLRLKSDLASVKETEDRLSQVAECRRLLRGEFEESSQAAELSRNHVNDVERGRRNCTLATIARLALALGVKMAELMPD